MDLPHISNFNLRKTYVPRYDIAMSLFEVEFKNDSIDDNLANMLTGQVSSAVPYTNYLIVKFNQIIFQDKEDTAKFSEAYTLQTIKHYFETPTDIELKISNRTGDVISRYVYSDVELIAITEDVYSYTSEINDQKQVVCIFKQ